MGLVTYLYPELEAVLAAIRFAMENTLEKVWGACGYPDNPYIDGLREGCEKTFNNIMTVLRFKWTGVHFKEDIRGILESTESTITCTIETTANLDDPRTKGYHDGCLLVLKTLQEYVNSSQRARYR